MESRFTALEPDKRQRILNAALSEFAARGFGDASTDRIVAEAGISKGALFHYFGTKEKLYLYLLDWSADTIGAEVSARLDPGERDLFERLLQGSRVKLGLLREHPDIWRFWDRFEWERPDFASDWLQDRLLSAAPDMGRQILDGIDIARFKPGLDPTKAINVIVWTFAGWADAIWAAARRRNEALDLEQVFTEADEYVRFLRTVFYADAEGG